MKIDGVDFWSTNRHIIHIWDYKGECGPMVALIDEKVRVGQEFMIYLQSDKSELLDILQRQSSLKHESTMSVLVVDKKTLAEMYNVHFQVILKNIRFGPIDYTSFDPSEIFITYMCAEAEDKTNYDSKAIREISE
jgi:hypothetical protein